MFAHPHQNGEVASRKQMAMPLIAQSSPLLITSTQHCNSNSAICRRNNAVSAIRVEDYDEDVLEPIEIKELCQSPKSSRLSMFSFSPSPKSSPEPPSPQADPPQADPLQADPQLSLVSSYASDGSSQSSPEGTPVRLSKLISPTSSDKRRYMVINELVTTESKYIENLNTILCVFMPAFEHVVAARDLRLLIPAQLEMLLESHQDILRTLKHRMNRESGSRGLIGDVFCRLCGNSNLELFNMYRVYMGEFKIAMRTLASYEAESPQFKEILNLLQQSPLCERLSLASYLLTPIQRLPRYELLLKELLKSTSLDHPDHRHVAEALSSLHEELTKLNLSIKSCQMACPAVRSSPKQRRRKKPSRTMSMLKKFVSVGDSLSSSGPESPFTTDDIGKPPALRMFRRTPNRLSGSDFDLSSSLNSSAGAFSMFRRGTLVSAPQRATNRAVSCSDLMLEFREEDEGDYQEREKLGRQRRRRRRREEEDEEEEERGFPPLLPPLASADCTPSSSKHSSLYSHRDSYLYSSSSSLSSTESNRGNTSRDASLTPVASPNMAPPAYASTPNCTSPPGDKDSTLKLMDTRCEVESDSGGSRGQSSPVVKEEEICQKKSTWKAKIFRKKKSGAKTRESKYIRQNET